MIKTGNEPSSTGGIKAMIFAAGLGTRFKPWTDKHPKSLAIINGKTLLQRNVEYLQQYGITNVLVNVHHFASQVVEATEVNNGWGSTVSISDESDVVLETGGGLLKAAPFLNGPEPFVTLNADVLTDLNLLNLLSFHKENKALVSFGITNRKSSRYFLFDENNRLCGWRNTKTGEEKISVPKNGLVEKAYSTIAVFSPEIFSLIPFTGKFSLVDVYLALAADHLIVGYDHSGGKWVDVGKPESVPVAEAMFT